MSMNWKEKKKEILEEEQQLKPSEQLGLMLETSKIKYQNDLVMKSLAEYSSHFEEWENKMTDITNKRDRYFKDKIDDLKQSNDTLDKGLKEVINTYENSLKKNLEESFDKVERENRRYLNHLESQVKEISDKHKEVVNLAIWSGRLKIISSILTPLLLIYIAFIK